MSQAIQQVQRPGLPAATPQQPSGETAAMVLAAQAKALVSARFEIAIRQPRDIDLVRQKLMRECDRPSFAEVAIYRKPIGEGVEGPSIRFAEAAIQAMGNLAIETPAIYDDAEKRILRVSVADMETNVVHSKDVTIAKRVERSRLYEGQVALKTRINSRGKPVYLVEATDDEILNTENALVSKALRTTGLRLVPGWLIDECMTAVRATREKGATADPDSAKRKLLDAFFAVGVSAEHVKEWLSHPADTLSPAEINELRGIYTALKDGDATWREVMDARWQETVGGLDANATAAATGATTTTLKDKIRAKAEAGKKEPQAEPAKADTAAAPQKTPPSHQDLVAWFKADPQRKPADAMVLFAVGQAMASTAFNVAHDPGESDEPGSAG